MLNGRIPLADIDSSECRKSSAYEVAATQALLFDDAGIRKLFSTKPARYSAKEIVYSEGAEADTVIVIRSGMVKLISHLANGRARIVRVHSKGSWLGLGGVLGQPYEHTAIAVEDTDAYRIPVSELLRIKSDNPFLYCRLIECWFDYLQEADLWIAEFSTGSIKARVARLVNFLSKIEGQAASDEVKLLTCEEMAEILGATPESVSRVLAEFKRSNILSPSRVHPAHSYQRNTTALDMIAQH
jgi:CRP/FNR family transcriptional regulator